MTENNKHNDWWKQAVVYQVYPRSFRDANGDGLGDIKGVTEKLPYLRDLGVDALWLSPFYPSDLADGGYDVIDYRNVDPRLGTMQDFDEMASEAHASGLKVIVDIVPNHTATKHVWFQEALKAGRGSAARERYIFREGRGENGELPPNNWQSFFGGPAWEQVADGQWYLHIFAKEQADLNWKNPEVHEDFKKTLRFWSNHGTDGFRIDVAHGLAKDLDSKPLDEMGDWDMHDQLNGDGRNPLWDRDEVHQIYREWREVFNEYSPARFAVGEAWVVPEHQYRYASQEELGQVFNFEFAKANWNQAEMRTAIDEGLASARRSGSTTTWVMSNHDVPRVASRYGLPQVHSPHHHQLAKDWILRDGDSYHEDRAVGAKRARAAILMEAGLPGSLYIYQGEELGLYEVANLPWDKLEDPTAFNTLRNYTDKGRDGCRVPLPWVAADKPSPASWSADFGEGASFGFSPATMTTDTSTPGAPAAEPHLPQPLWFGDFAADIEEGDPSSMLNLYRKALQLRAQLITPAGAENMEWLKSDAYAGGSSNGTETKATQKTATAQRAETTDSVIAYTRTLATDSTKRFASITNFGSEEVVLPEGDVILTSAGGITSGRLPQDTTAWLLIDIDAPMTASGADSATHTTPVNASETWRS